MFARDLVIAAASVLCATAVTAQTHGQQLESAIFAEETAGNLDAAIRIYEGLAGAPDVPREIASRARSRLIEARRQRDDTIRLMASAADQGRTGQPGQIDPPPVAPRTTRPPSGERYSDYYDAASPVSVTGFVTEVQWTNPHVVIFVTDGDGQPWGFVFGPPENLTRSGWTRDSLKVGEQVQASGTLAKGVGACPAPLPNGCATFSNGARHANARTMTRTDGSGNVVRVGAPPVASQPAGTAGGRGGRGGRGGEFSDFYDPDHPVSVVGVVTEVQWSNPHVVVYLNGADGKFWGFTLPPPDMLARNGWSRDSIKVGDQLRAEGVPAKGVGANCPGPLPNGCATFSNGALHATARQLLRLDGHGNVAPVVPPNAGQPAGGRGARGSRGSPPQ